MDPGVVPGGNEQRLRALLDVGRALVSDFELEAVLERVISAARVLTGARYAALGVLDEAHEGLERFLTSGIDDETREVIGALPRGRGVLGVLIDEPRPLRLSDVGSHPHSYGYPPGHPPMNSFLGVPIHVREEVYGNLYLTEKDGGAEFDAADEEALIVLAEWAAIAIENARAYALVQDRRDELEQAVSSLEATSEIAHALAGETDLEHVLELIAKRARALTEARASVVLLREGEQLEAVAVAGELDRAVLGERIPIEGSVSGQVFRTGNSERLPDAPSRLRFSLAEQTQAETGLFVPLRLRGRVLGVLAAFDRLRAGPQFTARDEQLLSAFATSAAAAVATAQDVAVQSLRRSIVAAEEERKRWARELHDGTLQELAALKLLLATVRIAKDEQAREAQLRQAGERIDVAVRALRDLITDLRPASLDELGLKAALEALAERITHTSELRVDLDVDLAYEAGREATRLTAQIEDTVYRVVQEALTNVAKHSGGSHADVVVREQSGTVAAVVGDNGVGFDEEGEHTGFGLLGMQERVALAHGTLTIDSTAGEGTTVRISIPSGRAVGGTAAVGA
jgi:two-component system, NarL family, sensor histidine kinase DevS